MPRIKQENGEQMPVKKLRQSPPALKTMWDAICCSEIRGVYAKVVTFLSTVTDFHPVFSGEW